MNQNVSLAEAVRHHQAGRLADAERLYRQLLRIEPKNAMASHLLGAIALQKGRSAEAARLIERALELQPRLAAAWSNLGLAAEALGQTGCAALCFGKALALEPTHVEALVNLAELQVRTGFDGADAARRATLLDPAHANGWIALGNASKAAGRMSEALEAYAQATSISPGHVGALFNLGTTLVAVGRRSEAIPVLRRSAAANHPDSLLALAFLLHEAGFVTDAEPLYRRVIQLRPDAVKAHLKLAGIEGDHIVAAERHFMNALALAPDSDAASFGLAHGLEAQGLLRDATAWYRRSAKIRGDDGARFESEMLFAMIHDAEVTPEAHFAATCDFARRYARALPKLDLLSDRRPDRQLRVGLVSKDLRSHPVGHFTESLLRHYDRDALSIFVYAGKRGDGVSERLKRMVEQWRDVSRLTDQKLAELIAAEAIDILIDLSGHTAGNRLMVFARRPAPVQVTWLGYPGSTGIEAIDWRITDGICDPPGMTEHLYTERLWRLPTIWNALAPPLSRLEPPPHPPADEAGHVVFGNFNRLSKLSDPTLALWGRILAEVPDSRLLLKDRGLGEDELQARWRARLVGHGIRPERVTLMGMTPEPYAPYNQVDVALDPFPYNGTTTTVDALWMGVPVVSLAGRHCASRAGCSILDAAGLAELVAADEDEYIRIAARLGTDRDYLRLVRRDLRRRVVDSPVMDGPRFAREFTEALRGMWHIWCRQG